MNWDHKPEEQIKFVDRFGLKFTPEDDLAKLSSMPVNRRRLSTYKTEANFNIRVEDKGPNAVCEKDLSPVSTSEGSNSRKSSFASRITVSTLEVASDRGSTRTYRDDSYLSEMNWDRKSEEKNPFADRFGFKFTPEDDLAMLSSMPVSRRRLSTYSNIPVEDNEDDVVCEKELLRMPTPVGADSTHKSPPARRITVSSQEVAADRGSIRTYPDKSYFLDFQWDYQIPEDQRKFEKQFGLKFDSCVDQTGIVGNDVSSRRTSTYFEPPTL
jgi:hypothetical protein